MLFSSIREPSSPEQFSWQVHLGPGQSLKSLNTQVALVVYEDGTEAFSISAETARDANGASVPTHLTVAGSTITLTVEHKLANIVYPVVAQQEFETSYSAPTVIETPNWEAPPPVNPAAPPPGEFDYLTEAETLYNLSFGNETDEASASSFGPGFSDNSYPRVRTLYRSLCGPSCSRWKATVENAAYKTNSADTTWWDGGTEVHARVSQSTGWSLLIWKTIWNCGAKEPYKVTRGSHEHLLAYGHFTIESWIGVKKTPTATPKENNFTMQAWVYPNGIQEKHVLDWSGAPNDQTCPKAIHYN
jgi:hypothetical protein